MSVLGAILFSVGWPRNHGVWHILVLRVAAAVLRPVARCYVPTSTKRTHLKRTVRPASDPDARCLPASHGEGLLERGKKLPSLSPSHFLQTDLACLLLARSETVWTCPWTAVLRGQSRRRPQKNAPSDRAWLAVALELLP